MDKERPGDAMGKALNITDIPSLRSSSHPGLASLGGKQTQTQQKRVKLCPSVTSLRAVYQTAQQLTMSWSRSNTRYVSSLEEIKY